MLAPGLLRKQVAEDPKQQEPAPPSRAHFILQRVFGSLLEPFTSTWPSFKNIPKRGGTK